MTNDNQIYSAINNTSDSPIPTTHESQALLLRLIISLDTLYNMGIGAFYCLKRSQDVLSLLTIDGAFYGPLVSKY